MTHHDHSQQDPTEQLQQTTMNQGQRAIEQAIDLQRNVARMTLSAMQWQTTAQQQGFEMTKSMMQSVPGQQFTESMMQNYLQGLEAVSPEMERALESGMQAATRPDEGQRMGQDQRRGGRTETRRARQESGEWTGETGGQRRMEEESQYRSDQQGDRPRQYSQTGEWVSQQRTYGGEPSGRIDRRRPRGMESEPDTHQQGSDRSIRGERQARGQEYGQSGRQHPTSRPGSERGRPEDQYSRRTEPSRGERGRERRRQPVSQGHGGHGESTARDHEPSESREDDFEGDDGGMSQDDMQVSVERSQQEADDSETEE